MSPKHIHIVGCLPRSGTTLMTELMINCFEIDAYTDHEHSIFKEFPKRYDVLCTKKPNDIKRIAYPLKVNDNLFVLYMQRDPRDTLSSRSHKNNKADKKIWGTLEEWLNHQRIAESLSGNSRFLIVSYEDLVSKPDDVQKLIQQKFPFLKIKEKFSEYHNIAKPSDKSNAALGGARPISTSSIGNWRKAMPYLKAQMEKYGDISDKLIELGYEESKDWLAELKDVKADNSDEPVKYRSRAKQIRNKYFTQPRRRLLYRLSCSKTMRPVVVKLRHYLRKISPN